MKNKSPEAMARMREYCRAYYAKRKADPEAYLAYLEKKQHTNHANYLRRKQDAAWMEKQRLRNRQYRQGSAKTPEGFVRSPNVILPTDKPRYERAKVAREYARLHAAQKQIDLYAVYEQWGVLFQNDYPGMRNPLVTKRKQTTGISRSQPHD